MGHLLDLEILEAEDSKVLDKPVREFMSEILSLIGDSLVGEGYSVAVKPSLWRSLLVLRHSPLHLRERRSFPAKEARILNGLASREHSESLEANIDANSFRVHWQRVGLDLTRETCKPFASRGALDGQSLDFALDWPMKDDLEPADLGEIKFLPIRQPKATLRVS